MSFWVARRENEDEDLFLTTADGHLAWTPDVMHADQFGSRAAAVAIIAILAPGGARACSYTPG